MVLQPGGGVIEGLYCLEPTAGTTSLGHLPRRGSPHALGVHPGAVVTVDTVSHEGILEDQGNDPASFFGAYGVPRRQLLREACALAPSTCPCRCPRRCSSSGTDPHFAEFGVGGVPCVLEAPLRVTVRLSLAS
ncbi:MAG: hypothetical protein ACRDYU_20205 [Actinomycetes bacterium]